MTAPGRQGPERPVRAGRQGPERPERAGGAGAPLPPAAFAAALAGLPGLGPARLAALLRRWSPPEAWARIAGGAAAAVEAAGARPREARELAPAWRRAAGATDVDAVWNAHVEAGVGVHVAGASDYPLQLAADHEAPAVIFSRGDLAALDRRRVAIVGTRRCTRYGLELAAELGRDLGSQGVAVVSGLALGVDGAAHSGSLAAGDGPPVGVVGSGLDVVYPRRHARLWSQVASAGVLLSEAPLGVTPEGWRFPVRNRIIAALAEVVVVVESHFAGGCVHTVEAACERGRPVMAVPGSVRSSASAFTNALLADGCPPARDATDVLVALGLSTPPLQAPAETRPRPAGEQATVLEAVGWEPASLEEIVVRSGLGVGAASTALAHLERAGWVGLRAGWWERLSLPSARVNGGPP